MSGSVGGPDDEVVVSQWLAGRGQVIDSDGRGHGLQLPLTVHRASIVGVAMGFRSGRESLQAAHAIVRALIDDGVRAVCLEGAAQTSRHLDEWLVGGRGDPQALLADSQAFLNNVETHTLLTWLRRRNLASPHDPVRLVSSRASTPQSLPQIEAQLAGTDLDWFTRTGQRIAHLGGIAHLAAAGPRTVRPADVTGTNAGSVMAEKVRYACIAVTIGASRDGAIPPPPPTFTEAVLDGVTPHPRLIDLHAIDSEPDLPTPVRRWLSRPLRTRCVGPDYSTGRDEHSYVEAGPVRSAINALAHVPTVSDAVTSPR